MVADFTRHVVGALDERAGDVEVIHRDDGQRDEKIDQEDHHGLDLRMHLIGQRVGHAVHEGDVHVVPVALREQEARTGRLMKEEEEVTERKKESFLLQRVSH